MFTNLFGNWLTAADKAALHAAIVSQSSAVMRDSRVAESSNAAGGAMVWNFLSGG